MSRRHPSFVALTLALIGGGALGGLVPSPAEAQESSFRVALLVAEAEAEGAGAEAAIQSHLVDLPVDLVIERASGLAFEGVQLHSVAQDIAARLQSKAVFVADFRDPARIVLVVSIPKVGTTLIRHIDCAEETLSSRYEAAAVMIRGILVAMLGGGEIGIHAPPSPPSPVEEPDAAPPEEAPAPESPSETAPAKDESEPEPKPVAPPVSPNETPSRFSAAAAYLMGFRFSEEQLMFHAIRFGVSATVFRQLRLHLAYRFTLPFNYDVSIIGVDGPSSFLLQVSPHPIEVGGGWAWMRDAVSLRLGLAFVTDIVSWQSTHFSGPLPSNVGPSVEDRGVRLAITPMASLGWVVSGSMVLYGAFSLDILLLRPRFQGYDPGGQLRTLSTARMFNPGVHLGVRFSVP